MRMWEVEDNKAIPSNLVLEQDFVLRVRRLHRLGTAHLVVNVALAETQPEYGGRGPMESAQSRLRAFAESRKGYYAPMSNGDVFIIWPEDGDGQLYIESLLQDLFPEGYQQDDLPRFLFTYRLPANYTELRERVNVYVEGTKHVSAMNDENGPIQLLQTDAARGPLTAWSVNQIERLLHEIDLRRYIKKQAVFELVNINQWTPIFEECFIGFEDLRRAFFPRLEISVPHHLFLQLCVALDHALLANLVEHFEMIEGRKTSLNLSIPSVMDSIFAQFTRRVPVKDRGLIYFELHRADLLQDFEMTKNALQVLRREGFKVILDGITPDILDFVNLAALTPDYIKINVGKDHPMLLNDLAARAALARLPHAKIIFYHCDTDTALKTGRTLGISRFQGWLVDKITGVT